KKIDLIKAYILLGPCDMAHETSLIKTTLINEAKENIVNGEPNRILSQLVWDYYVLSSKRLIDLVENKNSQNIPIISKIGSFNALKSIKLPLLAVAGEFDDSCSDNIEKYLSLLIKNTDYKGEYAIVKGAGHTYFNHEYDLFKIVYKFILSL
ncbi:MAG: hypothetical protein J6T74_09355, partial [Clostridia bacterium]|nr:hypothetical protein [Clostridia bacterium]